MASGTALSRAGRAAAAADPGGVIASLAGGADKVTGEIVFQAAINGDLVAHGLFDQLGYWLGAGIASLVTIFDPEVVVVTGGLIAAGDLLLAPARSSFERFVFARDRRSLPPVLPARLGVDAGLIGAGLLTLDRMILDRQGRAGGSRRPASTPAHAVDAALAVSDSSSLH
jgi:glucokinase